MLRRGLKSAPPLIIGMVVCHCSVHDTCLSQVLCPTGICTEDILLVYGRYGVGERTFEIHDHRISFAEYWGYFLEEIVHAPTLCHTTHSTVKQYVAREKYCQLRPPVPRGGDLVLGVGGMLSGGSLLIATCKKRNQQTANTYHPTPNTRLFNSLRYRRPPHYAFVSYRG